MVIHIEMPRLGMTMEKGKIISWNGQEGSVIPKRKPSLDSGNGQGRP